ncbi:MAG: hypothetical protein IJY42_02645 [Clostridia bacterium]|nr:hypothetical protein [Clostridia bacterium]
MKHPSAKREVNTAARTWGLCLGFILICAIFAIVLAVIQIRGAQNPLADDGLTVRKHTVAGQRGKIYDTKGRLIVGNESEYHLLFEYDAMPDTYREINDSLLAMVTALEETGNGDKRCDDYFVLSGVYPNCSFYSTLLDEDSEERYWYDRFLEDSGLDADITPTEFCNYFIQKYKLYYYTDREVTQLIRLWYDLNRIGFSSYTSYTFAEDVSDAAIMRVEEDRIEGVTVLPVYRRSYPYAGYATHILGSVGKIQAEDWERYQAQGYSMDAIVGVSGCEEAFESYLHSQNGVLVQKFDGNGTLVEEYYEVAPITGQDVYLTIDMTLQVAAEDGLREEAEALIQATQGNSQGSADPTGAVVAQDPNTGAVLALASYPTYDLTRLVDQSYVDQLNAQSNSPWSNRALNGLYPPGSTYKVGVALAALEQGHITPDTCFTCNKVFHIDGKECLGQHGITNVTEAIRVSCNIFFYSVGELFGLSDTLDVTTALGLGVASGIELPESLGNVADSNTVSDDIMGSIGQSTHIYTPMQLSVYLSTIVNGGNRYQAHLFSGTQTEGRETQPDVAQVVPFGSDTYDLLMDAMEQVVSSSATLRGYFSNLPDHVTVGGKTGTAQTSSAADSYDNAVFMGYAASEQTVDLVVVCVIEEGLAGGNAAIPVSRVMNAFYE